MACFLVPTAEAVVVTAVTQVVKSNEQKRMAALPEGEQHEQKVPFSRKLKWLLTLLWGGALLLAFEHLWHGEVTPWFPFLTAAKDPADTAEMLSEMSSVGVTMAVLVTVVWAIMVLVSNLLELRVPGRELSQ